MDEGVDIFETAGNNRSFPFSVIEAVTEDQPDQS